MDESNAVSFVTNEIITNPVRSEIHITHSGSPPKTHATFAITNKKPKFPSDLWETGQLIYSLRNPVLPPQNVTDKSDRILRFDSRFESGNLLKAYHLHGDSYHLILEQDCNKSGSCQWFYFQIKNIKKEIKYTFIISGFHKFGGVFTSGSKVFVYSEQNAKATGTSWYRDGTNYQFGITQKSETDKRSTLQFQMKFNYDNDTVYFAYGIPYTYSDLLNYIQKWQKSSNQIFAHEILCKSYGGRDCPMLTITNRSIPANKKEYLMFTGRCHPGESNGSVVLHGLIEFFLSTTQSAQYLRNHYIIVIVPMINIDGVIEGYYRICQCGHDLNRMWTTPDPNKHPIVYHTKQLLAKLKPKVYIDFHGHSRMNGTFAFGCPNADENHDREKVLPKIISYTSSAFSYGKCMFSIPPKRQSASRCVAKLEMGILQSFTLETSFGGIVNGKFSSVLYDEGLWKKIGLDIGESIYNLLTTEHSKIRVLVEKELKLNVTEPKPLIKGIISSQSIKIATPMKGCLNGSAQIIHNRQSQKPYYGKKLNSTIIL
ncbi:Clan MC, family M14, Zinc carboxypeptidase-like metallopeptidase [Tritrichomonas foetus]|uniref:Clan MC, family M14, Zinc carboxypeptidase-like metallopeptidase n=1 Tax=Tritrichomonas foetus TaxID=1144522 RepID=A0A1J4JQS6_9EUKA|nr:Clan MC, family M14, Zinc carboxypeptidase-like metallopeptidase [Tritrichomonas foetus]|eukprot:OHT01395.1 Clan MC, family M14, Zinc carboxypeptidase-like metallopeptidase [Tritrichomonas foetus]